MPAKRPTLGEKTWKRPMWDAVAANQASVSRFVCRSCSPAIATCVACKCHHHLYWHASDGLAVGTAEKHCPRHTERALAGRFKPALAKPAPPGRRVYALRDASARVSRFICGTAPLPLGGLSLSTPGRPNIILCALAGLSRWGIADSGLVAPLPPPPPAFMSLFAPSR